MYFKNVNAMLNPQNDSWGGMRDIKERLEKAAFGNADAIMKQWYVDRIIGMTEATKLHDVTRHQILKNIDLLDHTKNDKGHYIFTVISMKKFAAIRHKERQEELKNIALKRAEKAQKLTEKENKN